MNETHEPRMTDKPDWLELPEEEKINHTYWVTSGTAIGLDETPKFDRWIVLFHSQEEAEASASKPNPHWTWNGKRAEPCNLKDELFNVRVKGFKGIRIRGYQNGEWKILKEYPADVPLI